VVANARQIHVERILELAVHFLLDVMHVLVFTALRVFTGQIVFPVRTPGDLLHALAGDLRQGTRGRRRLRQLGILQMGVVIGERLVVIVNFRHIRIGEYIQQFGSAAAGFQFKLAVLQFPAAMPFFLIFPGLGIADAGLGFDVVEPSVFHPLAIGPHVFAGDRAGVATDAFVQIEDKGELCAYFHDVLLCPVTWRRRQPG
jgi:hypothetical protein